MKKVPKNIQKAREIKSVFSCKNGEYKMNIPKDRLIIIQTQFGKRAAIWSEADKQFVYADVRLDIYEGKWNMHYFENEYINEEDITYWKEI